MVAVDVTAPNDTSENQQFLLNQVKGVELTSNIQKYQNWPPRRRQLKYFQAHRDSQLLYQKLGSNYALYQHNPIWTLLIEQCVNFISFPPANIAQYMAIPRFNGSFSKKALNVDFFYGVPKFDKKTTFSLWKSFPIFTYFSSERNSILLIADDLKMSTIIQIIIFLHC